MSVITILLYVLAICLILIPKRILWLVASIYALILRLTNQLDGIDERNDPLTAIGIAPESPVYMTVVRAWRISGVIMLGVAIYISRAFF